MTIFDKHFPLGLGTNRFPIKSLTDVDGMDKSIRLVLYALESGVDYIDVAHNYSRGLAHEVLKRAFVQTKREFSVTIKSSYTSDRTADDVKRRVDGSLAAMGLQRVSYFVAWNISSYSQFMEIMRKGGLYDGAQYCKDHGFVDSICFSTHAPPNEVVKIMESGAFDGVTISHNVTNAAGNRCVFAAALKMNMGIAVMNPLAGGVIPQNREFFKFICNEEESSTVVSALRYIVAEPSVKIVLTGASSIEEFDENLLAFTTNSYETPDERLLRVNAAFEGISDYCTGCDYCSGCPSGIPISAVMQSRNALSFSATELYGKRDSRLLENIRLFREMRQRFQYIPETPDNPCVRCGKCEANCTQNLAIIHAVDDLFSRVREANYSRSGMKERLDVLLNHKGYKRIGFYPAGEYTTFVLQMYRDLFGEPSFDSLLFDSNSMMWGMKSLGLTIHSPLEISNLAPECLFVCNYKYQGEILESLLPYREQGIDVLCLHEAGDVPWVF